MRDSGVLAADRQMVTREESGAEVPLTLMAGKSKLYEKLPQVRVAGKIGRGEENFLSGVSERHTCVNKVGYVACMKTCLL